MKIDVKLNDDEDAGPLDAAYAKVTMYKTVFKGEKFKQTKVKANVTACVSGGYVSFFAESENAMYTVGFDELTQIMSASARGRDEDNEKG